MMMFSVYFLLILGFSQSSHADPVPTPATEQSGDDLQNLGETRRIIGGSSVFDTRPYMVWLRPASLTVVDSNWLCGGVIIHETYILTSAACIEDIKQFYVVSGTHKWLPPDQTNQCIQNGAMRAIWKCVPRTYRYDGTSFNNIRWMVNDIAVVQTEEKISFSKKVKGCDFIPNQIKYNNISTEFEDPATKGFIAGWGSEKYFTEPQDIISHVRVNSPVLKEGQTIIINKLTCKQRWSTRYHMIIDNFMICGKQSSREDPSVDCHENHVDCRQLVFSEEVGPLTRRLEREPQKLLMESAAEVRSMERARKKTRRSGQKSRRYAGFCENDHGGPLIMGRGRSAMVVGIMSAYRAANQSKECSGPFLFTSVYKNRYLIQCALFKELGSECGTVLRDSATVMEEESFDWGDTPFRSRAIYENEDDVPVLRAGNNTVVDKTTENSTPITENSTPIKENSTPIANATSE